MRGAVVAVDVDGVLPTDPAWAGGVHALSKLGYRSYEFDGLGPDGRPAAGTVWLNPEHGQWLRALVDRGAELAWATSWGARAAEWIAPRLDLPAMPVIDVPNHGPASDPPKPAASNASQPRRGPRRSLTPAAPAPRACCPPCCANATNATRTPSPKSRSRLRGQLTPVIAG